MGNKLVEVLSTLTKSNEEVLKDILLLNFTVVTACMVGDSDRWVLVDTGLENSADYILKMAEERFGKESRPRSIILTHGHFDHVGSVIELSRHWDVPVHAHELELPHLTGRENYPQADPESDSGMVAKMSPTFPTEAIDLGDRVRSLPPDGEIPDMPEWKWIHTPGHSPGHISLFREEDRTVIAGDALSTTKQESLLSVVTQKHRISGPPKYLTPDWEAARESVLRITALEPHLVIASHGKPMKGRELTENLKTLVEEFEKIARPDQGRYVE